MAKARDTKAPQDPAKIRMADVRARVHFASGALHFGLEMFGDHIAEREGYKAHDGMEAVKYYIVQKHGWLPRDVNAMSHDEMRFLLAEEMHGWTLPMEARKSYPHLDEKSWEGGA